MLSSGFPDANDCSIYHISYWNGCLQNYNVSHYLRDVQNKMYSAKISSIFSKAIHLMYQQQFLQNNSITSCNVNTFNV